MSTSEEIYAKVARVLAESLNVDEDSVTPEATLQHDLGAESIDFLDIVFRLEREFGIKIPRGELFPEAIFQGDPKFVRDGRVTDAGMGELRSACPTPTWAPLIRIGGPAADREFPGFENVFDKVGGAVGAPVDRRRFLQLMGASLALMGLGGISGCRRPDVKTLPYARSPEAIVPGMPLYYATSIPRPEGCYPILVESHEGRPTKVEGNPSHPLEARAPAICRPRPPFSTFTTRTVCGTCARAISRAAGKPSTPLSRVTRGTSVPESVAGVARPSEDVPSPALHLLREHLAKTVPEAVWHAYEPLDRDSVRGGARLVFGEPLVASHRLDRADVVLAVDADFLGDDAESVRHAREFVSRRSGEKMNRLYVVENTYTIAGGRADHRLSLPASGGTAYLLAASERVLGLLGVEPRALGRNDLKAAAERATLSVPQPSASRRSPA